MELRMKKCLFTLTSVHACFIEYYFDFLFAKI